MITCGSFMASHSVSAPKRPATPRYEFQYSLPHTSCQVAYIFLRRRLAIGRTTNNGKNGILSTSTASKGRNNSFRQPRLYNSASEIERRSPLYRLNLGVMACRCTPSLETMCLGPSHHFMV